MQPKTRRRKLWMRNYQVVAVLLAGTLPVVGQIQEPVIVSRSSNAIGTPDPPDEKQITIISQGHGADRTFVGRNEIGFAGGLGCDNGSWPQTSHVQASTDESMSERATGTRHLGFRVLYATNWESNDISAFRLNLDGTLQGPPQLFPVANGAKNPLVAVLSPSGKHLYVSNWGSGDVSTYRIGGHGELIPEATTKPAGPLILNAAGMVVSNDGKRLFLAAFNDGGPSTVQCG